MRTAGRLAVPVLGGAQKQRGRFVGTENRISVLNQAMTLVQEERVQELDPPAAVVEDPFLIMALAT